MKISLFETESEVLQYLRAIPGLEEIRPGVFRGTGVYSLQKGEYARPTYSPVKMMGGWGIKKEYYFRGVPFAPVESRMITWVPES
jgi:hypothetical protein